MLKLWFGPSGNVTKVYDGPAITSFALPTLNYGTTYDGMLYVRMVLAEHKVQPGHSVQ